MKKKKHLCGPGAGSDTNRELIFNDYSEINDRKEAKENLSKVTYVPQARSQLKDNRVLRKHAGARNGLESKYHRDESWICKNKSRTGDIELVETALLLAAVILIIFFLCE